MVDSMSTGGESDAESCLYTPGVDYVSGWREAREAAQVLNAALEQLGVDVGLFGAVPHAGPRGEPVLWLRPEGARLIAQAMGPPERVVRQVDHRKRCDRSHEGKGTA